MKELQLHNKINEKSESVLAFVNSKRNRILYNFHESWIRNCGNRSYNHCIYSCISGRILDEICELKTRGRLLHELAKNK